MLTIKTLENTSILGGEYRPSPESLPPIYSLPLRCKACLLWIWRDLVFPYGLFFLGLAALSWKFLTPDLSVMSSLQPGWMLMIWLRNAILLGLVAGGLHWYLYIRRGQAKQFKFNDRWLHKKNPAFLWGNQVKDNMFWSLVSGSLIWSLYEAMTLWWVASGGIHAPAWNSHSGYLLGMTLVMFFWGSFHFYWIHRCLHWPPLYRIAHALHHRNVNVGPWSGISMHPLEHVLYFSPVMLWWVIPVDPILIIATGFFTGLGPAFSHCGFAKVKIGKRCVFPAGTHHHQLHHRYFMVNYGNPRAPLDQLFGTWHNGGEAAHAQFIARRHSK